MQLREASPRGWPGLINGKRGQLAQLLLQRNSAVKRLRDGKYCGFQFAHRQVLPLLLVEGIELVGEPLQLLHALRPAGKVFRGQCASTQLLPPLLRQRLRLIRPADQGLVDQLVAVADRPVRRQAVKLAKLALRLWQINRPRGRCRRQARYRSGILGDRNGRQVGLTQRQPSADGDTRYRQHGNHSGDKRLPARVPE